LLIAVNVIRGGKRIDCGAAILAKFDCDAEFYNRKVFDPAANAVDLPDRPRMKRLRVVLLKRPCRDRRAIRWPRSFAARRHAVLLAGNICQLVHEEIAEQQRGRDCVD
jgi:hypothetical protein